MADSRIILGVDPGTTIMGFGIIKVEGNTLTCLQLNELKLSQYKSHYERLGRIYARTNELIETFKPDEMALEAPFFGKNVQSNKNSNSNGKLELIHGSKMFLCDSRISITPKVGDFYFFPNYLMHTVFPFKDSDEERRSISFNAQIDKNSANYAS